MKDTIYDAVLSDGSKEKLVCCEKFGHFKIGDMVTVTRLTPGTGRFYHAEHYIVNMEKVS